MEKKTHYTCQAEHKTGCLHSKADIQRHPDEVHKNDYGIRELRRCYIR